MNKFYQKYKKSAVFRIVYIREAHPSDGRRPRPGPKDPTTIPEREIVASKCIKAMKLKMPVLIDNMKDSANKAYAAWPDRIYIITKDFKIGYAGGRGPWGFKPLEAEKAFKEILDKE